MESFLEKSTVLETMRYYDDNCDDDDDKELGDKSSEQDLGGSCNWSVACLLFYSLPHILSTRFFGLILDIFGKVHFPRW